MRTALLAAAALSVVAVAIVPASIVAAAGPVKPAVATTKPKLGSFGVDLTAMDTNVAPGDDFFAYVNGNWAKRTEIPADRASWGGSAMLDSLSEERTRGVIEEAARATNAPGTNAAKIATLWNSFMDTAAIEAAGTKPLQPYLRAIAAIATPADVARAFAVATRRGIGAPITLSVGQNLADNTTYTVYASQGGLGMPDRDYYLSDTPKFVETRAKYVAHVAQLLTLAGQPDASGAAQRIYDFEKALATVQASRAEMRQVEKSFNPFQSTSLGTRLPGFDWAAMLTENGLAEQPVVIVRQLPALTATAKLVAATPIATIREYLTLRTIRAAAPMMGKAFVDADFAFRGTVLSGTPSLRERWKRGVDVVGSGVGEAVGEIYVARYFPPEAKAKADALVRNVVAAMDNRLSRLDWMAPATKEKARTKLAAFTAKIGYPTKWRDYANFQPVAGDVVGNLIRIGEFNYARQRAKIGKPVDRTEWAMTPQTVNAYANPPMNEIVFPAAILQPPFFDPAADPAVNYGGIGAVIGHEISHHFDDQGRKFDPKGNFNEWWTAEDVTRFKTYTDRVVAQYGAYEPVAGMKVNGSLTLGENMADLAGVTVAYDAYRLSLGGKPAPVIGGFTGDQRFFMGFAQVWQYKAREAALRQQITTDPHTPANFRPFVVRNLDPWYAAFGVKPGQKLYLAPSERIKVW